MGRTLVVNEGVGEIRKSPDHASEQVTQVMLGHPLRVLSTRNQWFRVVTEDGYRGWIRAWSVQEFSQSEFETYCFGPAVEVDSMVARVREKATGRSDAIREATLGARLQRTGRSGNWIRLRLPDGERGYLHARDLLVDSESLRRRSRPVHIPAVLRTANRFLGVPYQWGGCTPKGLDCSGLTQTVFRLHGVLLPRDAHQQMQWVRAEGYLDRDLQSIVKGSLIFFGESMRKATHVGIGLGGGRMLHAMGRVRTDSLRPQDQDFNRDLYRKFLGAGPVPLT